MSSTPSHEVYARWEKVLWRRQSFDDNYVDASFLRQLRINATAAFPTSVSLVLSSLSIGQQMASVFLFVALFVQLHMGWLHAAELVWTSLVCSLLLAGAESTARKYSIRSIVRGAMSLTVLGFALHALSPVVRTFSEATTNDSVWACAAVLFVGHLAFANYSMRPDSGSRLTSTISLNMAMCASVVLSSRLMSDVDVFALLLVALQLFGIFPLLRDRMYVSYGSFAMTDGRRIPRIVIPLTAMLVCLSILIMWPLSRFVAIMIEPGAFLFVCFLCPIWMRRAQRWKTEIRGPWDEAVVT